MLFPHHGQLTLPYIPDVHVKDLAFTVSNIGHILCRFVLDYKIRELKLQIEPRQVEIVKMKAKINEMVSSIWIH